MLPFYILRPLLWSSAMKMIFRLKFFFLSILLIYFFFTPEISSEQKNMANYLQAILPGIFRITVLIFIVLAVNLLLKTSTKEEILAALLWLFSPLTYLGFDVERLSLRAVLTLEYIDLLSNRLATYKKNKQTKIDSEERTQSSNTPGLWLSKKKQDIYHLIEHSGIILHEILDESEKMSGKTYHINCLDAPLFRQLIIPVLITILYVLTM